MPELNEVESGGPGASRIVALDRSLLRRPGRVDKHGRQSGTTDRLDLRVVTIEPDHDHAVDRGARRRFL